MEENKALESAEMKSFDMSPEEKFEAVERLKKDLEDNFVQLGQLFSEIKRTKVFRLKGYNSFKDFVEDEYSISGSFASKLIGIYDLYVHELDLDDFTIQSIGADKLHLVKPMIKDASHIEQEQWIQKAKTEPTTEIREQIKEIRERERESKKTMKDVLIEQYKERMVAFFNCSQKELQYKLALFFQDRDLDPINEEIKVRQRRFEEEVEETNQAIQS